MNVIKFYFLLFILTFSISNYAQDKTEEKIQEKKDKEAFAFYLENDSRNIGGPGSDQAYSNGFKFSYIYAQDQIPDWSKNPIEYLGLLNEPEKYAKINYAISLGHQIYTPSDIRAVNLITTDRPYAAWLYLGFAVSLKENRTEQFFELSLGTVGPSAMGEQVQNNFHRLINTYEANGWQNGLNDEPTLQLFYQKRSKTFNTQKFDFIPYYGASLGNVLTGAHVGGMVRFGPNLPDDFGSSRPSASEGNSFITSNYNNGSGPLNGYYVFAGARGNYVARNLFLDGNTFRESHSVKKNPFVFETEFGISVPFNTGLIVWRFVTKSPEFELKKDFNSFASVSLIYSPP